MIRAVPLWLLFPAAMLAESITGAVYETGTRIPVEGATVSALAAPPAKSGAVAHSDAAGRYTLDKLAPGTYRITVSSQLLSASRHERTVTLTAAGLTGIDFEIDRDAEISGAVRDENGDPVSSVSVFLVSAAYLNGALEYPVHAIAKTDARGEYRIGKIKPNKPFLILARNWTRVLPAVSGAPENIAEREPVLRPAYYPDAPSIGGAAPLTLRSGEKRDGVDIRMSATPNYCIAARLETQGDPAALKFHVQDEYTRPIRAISVVVDSPAGFSYSGNNIRVCDLSPGRYRIAVSEAPADDRDPPQSYGSAAVELIDRDERAVITAVPRGPLRGEVRWDGAPARAQIAVSVQPLNRFTVERERAGLRVVTEVPGDFEFPSLLPDDYSVRIAGLSQGQYVKEITYGGASVLGRPVPFGGAPGVLRITLAHDAASVTVKVADRDGEPVPYANVILVPAAAPSEASAASLALQGAADQSGQRVFAGVPPGKYYLQTAREPVDLTPNGIGNLWRGRATAKELEVSPRGSPQVTARWE